MITKRLFCLNDVKPGDLLVDPSGRTAFICRNESGYFSIDERGLTTQSYESVDALLTTLDVGDYRKAFRIVNGPRRHMRHIPGQGGPRNG